MQFRLSAVLLAATMACLSAPVGYAASAATVNAKTNKQCEAEYGVNRDAIKGSGEKKADFMTACKAGTEVIPSAATTSGSAAPATTTPAAAPTRSSPTANARPATTTAGTPSGANQFASEGAAKSHCPGGTVVWVNLDSRIFHFSGYRDYGTTKSGAYICESDATNSGFRAAKNEKQPAQG